MDSTEIKWQAMDTPHRCQWQAMKILHQTKWPLLRTPYTKIRDKRHNNFEDKVGKEDKNEVFHLFHYVHCDIDVILHFIYYVKTSFHFIVPLC